MYISGSHLSQYERKARGQILDSFPEFSGKIVVRINPETEGEWEVAVHHLDERPSLTAYFHDPMGDTWEFFDSLDEAVEDLKTQILLAW